MAVDLSSVHHWNCLLSSFFLYVSFYCECRLKLVLYLVRFVYYTFSLVLITFFHQIPCVMIYSPISILRENVCLLNMQYKSHFVRNHDLASIPFLDMILWICKRRCTISRITNANRNKQQTTDTFLPGHTT